MGESGFSLVGFLGTYKTTMDSKGRFPLPARLRSVKGSDDLPILDGNLVITKGLEGCLSVYPENEWMEIQNRLSSVSFTKKNYRYFSRRFYASANTVTCDKSGRILLPAPLIAEAHLKKEVLVIGLNRSIEIWDPERYSYYIEQFAGSYEEVAERIFSGDDGAAPEE